MLTTQVGVEAQEVLGDEEQEESSLEESSQDAVNGSRPVKQVEPTTPKGHSKREPGEHDIITTNELGCTVWP